MSVTPHIVAEVVLGAGLAAAGRGLLGQLRAKKAALRALAGAEHNLEQHAQHAERERGQERAEAARREAELDSEIKRALAWSEALMEEMGHLAEQRLPAVVDKEARNYPGIVVPDLSQPLLQGSPVGELHSRIVEILAEAVQETRSLIASSARAAVGGIAGEALAHLTRLQLTIDENLDKHPQAAEALFEVDRSATLTRHEMQRLGVMAGAWPGTQRANATFREIVEAARGRILPYERVLFTYQPQFGELWVEGPFVEPLVIALTELLRNATAYSPHDVTVYVQPGEAGHLLVVEDRGWGLNRIQREQAERALAGGSVDVTALEDERKLGFAVIGRLVNQYPLRVDVGAPSSGGGVKAVVLVPNSLMGDAPETTEAAAEATETTEAEATPETAHPAPSAAMPLPEPSTDSAPAALTTHAGLPQRKPRTLSVPLGPSQEVITDSMDPENVANGFGRIADAFDAFRTHDEQGN